MTSCRPKVPPHLPSSEKKSLGQNRISQPSGIPYPTLKELGSLSTTFIKSTVSSNKQNKSNTKHKCDYIKGYTKSTAQKNVSKKEMTLNNKGLLTSKRKAEDWVNTLPNHEEVRVL